MGNSASERGCYKNMDLQRTKNLACPRCLGALHFTDGEVICQKCTSHYEVRAGIPMLCVNTGFYYGEVPRAEMTSILEDTRERGWQAALWRYWYHKDSEYFINYVSSDLRAAFKFILNKFGQADVLDYGCGLGNLACSLARSFRSVIGVDMVYERAAFTGLRAQQDGLSNVSVLCAGDTDRIPLKDGSVDIVVLNGVLEWIPELRNGDPREQQIRFLKEFWRVLRPGGQIFIGIENRTAYRYFIGHPEDHTRLPFASLLPRRMANAYSNIVRKKPFRNYTYTRWGYASLLHKAAFGRPKFYGMLPTYREIRRIVDFSKPEMRAASLENTSLAKQIRNVALRRMLPSIIHSYGITANRGPVSNPSFIDELAAYVGEELRGGPFVVERVSASAHTPTVQLQIRGATERLMVRLSLTPHVERCLQREHEVLPKVHQAIDDSFRCMIPDPIHAGILNGQFYSIISFLPGVNLGDRTDLITAVLPAFCDFVVHFALKTRQPSASRRDLIRHVATSAKVELLAACREKVRGLQELSDRLDAIVETLIEATPDTPGFACAVHGDFWVGNVLVHSGHVSGVFDWDHFQSYCVPGIDWVDFLASQIRMTNRQAGQNEYVQLFEKLRTNSPQRMLLSHYCWAIGMNDIMLPVLVVLAWLSKTAKEASIPDRFQANEVIQANVINASEYFSRLGQLRTVDEAAMSTKVDQAFVCAASTAAVHARTSKRIPSPLV